MLYRAKFVKKPFTQEEFRDIIIFGVTLSQKKYIGGNKKWE